MTVLFADLKGSMELLADRDPEEARKLLDPVLERMMEAVHRYEGTVNQVMGDGSWRCSARRSPTRTTPSGAAMPRPDAGEREAVRRGNFLAPTEFPCASAWASTPARSLSDRSGRTSTWTTRRWARPQHLAARMEQMADPGAILLTPDTLHLAEGFVQVQSLGIVAVKA